MVRTERAVPNYSLGFLYQFDCFEEYLDRASAERWKLKKYHKASGHGTPEFEQHLDYARNGNPGENLADLSQWANMLFDAVSTQIPRPDIDFDRTGCMWDLERVMSGDPECWIHETPATDIDRGGRGNIVRITINTAASYACYGKSHRLRMPAIIALMQLLELCGFLTQFEVVTAICRSARHVEFRTVTKYPHQALNVQALTYWCSKDMERKIDFSICETINELVSGAGDCYGGVSTVQDRGDICFDGMDAADSNCNWNDPASVCKYLRIQLEAQGVTLNATA